MSKKNQITTAIAERIRNEHRKHSYALDWARIAAIKVYSEHIEGKCGADWMGRILFFVLGSAVAVVTITFLK